MVINCENIAKRTMEKDGVSNETEFRHAVAKEIVRLLSACGSSYEDAKNIFEIATWRMNTQSVQSPDD